MEYLFYNCSSLKTLDLSSFDTSQVNDMEYLFYNCSSLKTLDLSSFDTSQVTSMCKMFYGCISLTELDLRSFNLSNLYNDNSNDNILYNNEKLTKIYTPLNLNKSVELSKYENSEWQEDYYDYTWYMPDGTIITELPQGLDYSVVITTEKPAASTTPETPSESETPTESETPSESETETEQTPEVKYVTVTFNANGGSEVDSQSVVSGKKAKSPEAPTKMEYTFAGWYEDEGLTNPYGFDSAVNEDITLYAKWEKVTAELKCRFAVTDTYAQNTGFTYTGSAITPEIVVTYKGETLTKDTDYTVTYKNNINAESSAAGSKAPTVIVKGKGGYSGSCTKKFTINPVDLTSDDVKCASSITVVKGQKVSKVTVIYKGKTLGAKDYNITYDDDHKDGVFKEAGKIFLEGKGNFKTETSRQIVVNVADSKKNLQTFKVDLKFKEKPYTGSEIELTSSDYTIKNKSTGNTISNCFLVTYSNNVKVGTAKVTFTGTGIYNGCTVTKTFKITAPTSNMTIDSITESVPYNPSGATLGRKLVVRYNGNKLVENTDYKVTYKNNKKSGTNVASYTVTFIGDYKGFKALKDKKQTFSIDKPSFGDSVNVNAVSADKVVKNSGAYKSAPVVTYMGTTVAKNEYKVKYYIGDKEITGNKLDITDSTATTVTVKIKSTGKTFANDNNEYEVCTYTVWNSAAAGVTDISKVIKKINITTDTAKTTYTGKEIKPIAGSDITITTKDGKEIKDDDFTNNFDVEYCNNINIGKATVIIKAKEGSGYIGSKTATFQITKPTMTK
jgi:uncharacterized repeat protein (TIGR02543 family)